jgi:hypothetical protein
MEIFRALIASTSNVGNGNPKMKAFLLDLVEDYVLGHNLPLACDVLMRKADHSFAIGAAGYSQESASIAWDRMFERTPGIDTVEVAKTLTRAYIQKQGDKAAINVRTVWDHAHMAHEINHRMITILSNYLASAERGKDNARKFKELLATARVRVQNGDAKPQEASCVQLCQNYLGPYEESRADLYKTSNESGPVQKPPSRSVNNIRAQITAETTTSSRPASNDFNNVAAITALQSQINNMQQNQMGLSNLRPDSTRYLHLSRRPMTTVALRHRLRTCSRLRQRRPIRPILRYRQIHLAVPIQGNEVGRVRRLQEARVFPQTRVLPNGIWIYGAVLARASMPSRGMRPIRSSIVLSPTAARATLP